LIAVPRFGGSDVIINNTNRDEHPIVASVEIIGVFLRAIAVYFGAISNGTYSIVPRTVHDVNPSVSSHEEITQGPMTTKIFKKWLRQVDYIPGWSSLTQKGFANRRNAMTSGWV